MFIDVKGQMQGSGLAMRFNYLQGCHTCQLDGQLQPYFK